MRTFIYLLTMTATRVSVILFTAILFLIASSCIFFSNNQPTFVQAISANESNRVLGGITSLLSSNPDIGIRGFHALGFNASNSKPDVPAAEKGRYPLRRGMFN
jgi:hypothetical protein